MPAESTEKEKIGNVEGAEKSPALEVSESAQEVAQESISKVETAFASFPNTQDSITKIESSVTLDNPAAAGQIAQEMDLVNTLNSLDQEAANLKAETIERITRVMSGTQDDLATRNFSKAYHSPQYRTEVAKSIMDARRTGKDAEQIRDDFNQKTAAEKNSFESQEKERSVSEIMKEKDLVFLHGLPLDSTEERGSDFNNRVVNNKGLTFEDTYNLIGGLDPTISVFTPSADRPNNGMYKRQGVILGEGKVLSAKAQDSGSEAFGLQKRIPKYFNEDHKHSAIQPTIDVEGVVSGASLTGREVLYNEITVEKPQIAGLYYDLSIDDGQYKIDNPMWKATFGELSTAEMEKKMQELKNTEMQKRNSELLQMKKYSEKMNVPLYAFKNEGGDLKKYSVQFIEHPEYSLDYLKTNLVPKAQEILKNNNNNISDPAYQAVLQEVQKIRRVMSGEEAEYNLTPVTAEEIIKSERVISPEEKLAMAKSAKEKVSFIGESETKKMFAELEIVSKKEPFSAEEYIGVLEKVFPDTYEKPAGVSEGLTLKQHTVRVMNQFEKYFSGKEFSSQSNKEVFRFLLSVHDIGKPIASQKQEVWKQHEYTLDMIRPLLTESSFSQKDKGIIESLVDQDLIGEFIKAGNVSECVSGITHFAEQNNVSKKEAFELLKTFYICDAGSYTLDAGAKEKALDRLFKFNPEDKTVSFSPEVEDRIRLVETSL